jgi:hypothetical protein
MKRALLTVMAALGLAVPAVSHALAWIDLFPVVDGSYQSTCNFNEPASPGLREVAAVMNYPGGDAVGVRFGIAESGINWQRIGIATPYVSVGSFDDLSIGFGLCLTQYPAVIATLQYFASETSPCGTISVVAPSGFVSAFFNDCVFQELIINPRYLTVNGVYDVPPGGEDPSCFCPPAATQPTTWGRVKALYRN